MTAGNMKIKNFIALAKTPLRRVALDIVEEGLQAIDTERIIRGAVRIEKNTLFAAGEEIPLASIGRIFVAGIGKCAARAAGELERILGKHLEAGFIIVPGEVPALARTTVYHGTHPYPSVQNIAAAKALLEFLSGRAENDLVIFVATGGGSTLLCLPEDENWERESLIFTTFTKSGAPIEEINTVRKHMSRARGGFLAKAMYPARVVSLVMSDVPGSDDIGFIASGPTVKDTTTVEDAARILEKYAVLQACGIKGCGLMETPKEDMYFERVKNIVVVSNATALDAMAEAARRNGFTADIRDRRFSGEARDLGTRIADELLHAAPRTALIYGGETTVTIRVAGKGGRNQEVALGALIALPDKGLIIAAASDGRDNTDFGGGLCDILTRDRAQELACDPIANLEANRSYDFFQSVGDYLTMGDTGSNVSDLIVALKDG